MPEIQAVAEDYEYARCRDAGVGYTEGSGQCILL